jgi:hypothetical protein
VLRALLNLRELQPPQIELHDRGLVGQRRTDVPHLAPCWHGLALAAQHREVALDGRRRRRQQIAEVFDGEQGSLHPCLPRHARDALPTHRREPPAAQDVDVFGGAQLQANLELAADRYGLARRLIHR